MIGRFGIGKEKGPDRSSYTEVQFDNEGWWLRGRPSFCNPMVKDGRTRAAPKTLARGAACHLFAARGARE
jgi:hypothetical protein